MSYPSKLLNLSWGSWKLPIYSWLVRSPRRPWTRADVCSGDTLAGLNPSPVGSVPTSVTLSELNCRAPVVSRVGEMTGVGGKKPPTFGVRSESK